MADSPAAGSESPTAPLNANEGCVGPASEAAGKADGCAGCPNQGACATGAGRKEDPDIAPIRERMASIKHIILVLSGKGGVGKSTFSSQLAFGLAGLGAQVGLLDVDICGPSIPHMLGLEGEEIHQSNLGWQPVYVDDNFGVMSIGFMLPNRDDAVIWRGVRKNGLIKQFLKDTHWGELDFLVIDSPPGTSDEHITLAQCLTKACTIDGSIIVTTPQEVSLLDVRKEINFCAKTKIPVLGVVENMSGFCCPACETTTNVFFPSTGGAAKMAAEMSCPFLGQVPLDPRVSLAAESGESVFEAAAACAGTKALQAVIGGLLTAVGEPDLAARIGAEAAGAAEDMSVEATGAEMDKAAAVEAMKAQVLELQRKIAELEA